MNRRNKKQKERFIKAMNGWFKASIIFLLALILLAFTFVSVLHYTKSKLNIDPVSAFVKYRDWCEPIDDKTYLDEKEISIIEGYPTLVYNDGTVTFNIKKCDRFHMDCIYTGDEKFVYSSNDLWNKLVKTGQKYSEVNTSQGWIMTTSNSVKLSQDGWYTVFGVWYENGSKHYIVDCFNRNMHFVNPINEEAVAAYNRWNGNKNAVKKTEGVENYLIVGADKWTRKTEDDIFSDTVILATVNHTNKTVSFTNILKETYVYIPGIGAGRITNAYNCGGMELLLQTVRENFGININNYFVFDYQFFIHLVDTFGGVDFKLNKKEIAYINNYIDNLYKQYELDDKPENHYIKDNNASVKKLDGVQTLSYLRHYYEGDFARAERYNTLLNELRTDVFMKDIPFLINKVYPLITTDLTYTEYRDLVFDALIFKDYDVSYTSIPKTNTIAGFKENGEYTVLLTNNEDIQNTARYLTDKGDYAPDPLNLYDILRICFWSLVAMFILVMIYLAFIHKYKVVYVLDDMKYTKEKRYRFRKKVHLYHNHLPVKADGYFSDPQMTDEFDEDYRMPMKTLIVYTKVKEIEKENIDDKEKTPVHQ